MIIELYIRCYISVNMGYIINLRGSNRKGWVKKDLNKIYICV